MVELRKIVNDSLHAMVPEGWLKVVIIVEEEELLVELRDIELVLPHWCSVKVPTDFRVDGSIINPRCEEVSFGK
jgi:hypothetical protein